jgi:hypothetical protein
MKLVPIKYDTPVQSLGRESISNATAPALGAARAAEAATDFFGQATIAYRKHQRENATAELELELSEWKKEHAKKEVYDSTEVSGLPGVRLTEDVVDAKGEIQTVPRHEIPAYEVQTQLYEQYALNLVKSKGSGIDLSHDRGAWESKMNSVVNNQTAQNQKRSIGMMAKATAKQVEQNFKNAMNAQNYGAARGVINSAEMDPMKKVGMLREVNEREERDGLDNALIRMNRQELEQGLAVLTSEKLYESEDGILPDNERLTYARNFRTALNALNVKQRAGAVAHASRVNREAVEMSKALGTQYGHNIPPVAIENMRQKLTMLGEKGEANLHKLNLATNTMVGVRAFLTGNPTQRAQAMKEMEDAISQGDTSPASILLYDAVKEASDQATIAQNKDPLQYAIDNSVIDTMPLPTNQAGKVDFTGANTWGSGRLHNVDAARGGFDGITPIFTKQEALQINTQMDSASSADMVTMVTGMVDSFGVEDAKKAFTQLGIEKESGTWAHLGVIAAHDPVSAKRMLRGKDILEDNKGLLKSVSTEFDPEITARIGGVSAYYNTKNRKSVRESVMYAYAYLSGEDLNGEYDSERMDTAVQMATGGMMVVNDMVVQRPNPDVDSEMFDTWLAKLSPEHVGRLGGVHGYNSEDIIDYMRSGRIKMFSHGSNEYMLFDTLNPEEPLAYPHLRPEDAKPFTFKYSPEAPQIKPTYTNRMRGYGGG